MQDTKETTKSICLAQKIFVLFFKKGVVFSSCDFYKNKQMTAKTFTDQQFKTNNEKILKQIRFKRTARFLLLDRKTPLGSLHVIHEEQ